MPIIRFRAWLMPLLVASLSVALLAAQPARAKKVALVVGVNHYQHSGLNKPKALEFAEADVEDLAKELKAGGYDEVVVLKGKDATRANIRKKLEELRKLPGDGGVFLVAFAGHGLQPEKSSDAYYCPYDADQRVVPKNDPNPKDPWDYDSMLPLADVLAYLKASNASTRVLMVDACRNDPATGRGRGVGTALKVGDLPENTAVLLSCSRGQRAFEGKGFGSGHGAFFHHVLVGMREKGRDKKGRVTADSLWEYVREAVPEDVAAVMKGGAEQKPFRLVTGDVDFQISIADIAKGEPKAGEERSFEIADGVKMVFCYIPAGEAQLGSPKAEREAVLKAIKQKEEPDWLADESEGVRGKFKTKGFWLGKYEVTQAEWKAMMGDNPSYFDGTKENKAKGLATGRFPVDSVSWDDICTEYKKGDSFLVKLNKRGGVVKAFGKAGKFRLPHEDEWEYAYRGGKGNGRVYYWGDALNGTKANCGGYYPFGTATKGQFLLRTCAVDDTNDGKYAKHPWGLQHMSGNVQEWCDNKYSNGDTRMLRGGSFSNNPLMCRAASRFRYAPAYRYDGLGFRVCFRLD